MAEKKKINLSYGVTKEEHDAIVAKKNRPLTQLPIQKKSVGHLSPDVSNENVLEQLIKVITQRKDNGNS